MAEPGEVKPKIKKIEERIEPEVTEEEEAREESRNLRAIEEEKRLKELEREESRERFRAIEEEEKRLEQELRERILKKEEVLEEKEKKREERVEVIKEVMEKIGVLPEKVKKIIGKDSLVAWADREEMLNPIYVAKSLAGVASELSREWLDQNKKDRRLWKGICDGLTVDDSPEAWKIRDWLEIDSKENRLRGGRWAAILAKLGLHKSESFFKLREKSNLWLYGWPGFYQPGDLIMSTTGIKLDESERKSQLLKRHKDLAPAETLISLAGDGSEEANKIRKELGKDPKLSWAYKKSLIGTEIGKKEEYEKS